MKVAFGIWSDDIVQDVNAKYLMNINGKSGSHGTLSHSPLLDNVAGNDIRWFGYHLAMHGTN